MLVTLIAALAGAAAAWGESGVVQIASNDWTTSPVQHHAASCGASLYVPGTDPDTQRQTMYAFDATTSTWQRYADMPGNFFTPSVFCSGGILLATGGATEASSAIVAFLPLSTGASAAWQSFNLTKKAGAIGARAGHRMAEVGGIIYTIGGLDSPGTDKPKWSNVVFAMDAATAIVSNSTSGYVKLIAAGTPGLFSPRGSFSLDVLGGTIIMFGGLTRNAALEPFPGCGVANSDCVTFNEVWQWSPGTPTAPLSPAQCATPSCGWAQVEIVGVSPPARYSHASGVLADKLFIYGGLDANGGILADMWAFSRTDKSWALVTLSGAPLPTQSGAPAGAFLGSVFYLSLATPAGAALYRVKPCFDCAPAATGGGSPTNVGLIAGLVAGGGVLAAAAAFVYVRRPQWAGFGARGAADASAGHYFTSLS